MEKHWNNIILTGLLLLMGSGGPAQSIAVLELTQCYEMGRENYPLTRQLELIDKASEYSVANARKAYLPQIHVAGQAGYQSDVTQLPLSLPGQDLPQLSRDQYRFYTDVSQSLTDLFTANTQTEYLRTASQIERQNTESELYQLKDRINQLYFGVLLIDEQLRLNEIISKDIEAGIDQAQIAVTHGVALQSNVDHLKAELLKVRQQEIELKSARRSYTEMLSRFIGKNVNELTTFIRPDPLSLSAEINRPELTFFQLQKKSLILEDKLIEIKNMPRFSLFFQGGTGRPALNMLSNDLQPYFMTGIRLNWNIAGYYTYKNERNILKIKHQQLDLQEELFLFNTRNSLMQKDQELNKLRELMAQDLEIVNLRGNVKKITQNQLQYGTVTAHDYLQSVNAEYQARQNLFLREIQLLMMQYSFQHTAGF